MIVELGESQLRCVSLTNQKETTIGIGLDYVLTNEQGTSESRVNYVVDHSYVLGSFL